MGTRRATRCSSSSRQSSRTRRARSTGSDDTVARSSWCSCRAPRSRRPRALPTGGAKAWRDIHSPFPGAGCSATQASACRAGRTSWWRTATRWCARRTTRCTSPRRRGATESSSSTATSSTRTTYTMDQTLQSPQDRTEELPHAEELARLRVRVVELQRERDHWLAVVDILQEVSGSLHFVDVLQTIARKLGETFGLDRCAIFLSGDKDEVRLVASYEDPTIRNLVVDLNRYPELKRAFESGETVFTPDAASEPMLKSIRMTLDTRNGRSSIVVHIRWEGSVIGAIFLRTEREAEPFSEADVRFCQTIASLTAKALRNAHRFETLLHSQQDVNVAQRKAELQRVALVGFMRRLLDRYAKGEEHTWAETLLPKAADDELERLVTVAMQVFEEEAKG